jgi:rod shape-determining protein MreC
VAVYRRTARPRFTLFVLVLTAVTLVTLDERSNAGGVMDTARAYARDAFAPVESAAHDITSPVNAFVGGVVHYDSLKQENARLREQLAQARNDRLKVADAERERQALLDQQHLDFVGDIPTVAARVSAVAASNFQLTVDIDRGTNAGVAIGMPVVSGSGLVGRIVETSARRSTVLLVTDPTSNVGSRLATSGDVGVAAGTGPGALLRMDLVDPKTKVEPNEVVVTSGLQQGRFPPNIPIGRVKSSKLDSGALQQEVDVVPVVDLERLVFVQVLQWAPK